MNEQMEFPNTFDEFADYYGFKDSKEIYTNGSMLIPIFRVKQWLDHLGCEDCISREAVLEMAYDMSEIDGEHFTEPCMVVNIEDIQKLQPINQKPNKGHWVTQWNFAHQKEYYYCSECREEFSYDGETGIKMNDYDFCPNCGADMRGKE